MTLYNAFSELSRLDARYRGKPFVSEEQARALRASDGGYNADLSRLVGPIDYTSFAAGNRFDPGTWAEDVERFLEHPSLAGVKDRPELYRIPAKDVARYCDTE